MTRSLLSNVEFPRVAGELSAKTRRTRTEPEGMRAKLSRAAADAQFEERTASALDRFACAI